MHNLTLSYKHVEIGKFLTYSLCFTQVSCKIDFFIKLGHYSDYIAEHRDSHYLDYTDTQTANSLLICKLNFSAGKNSSWVVKTHSLS